MRGLRDGKPMRRIFAKVQEWSLEQWTFSLLLACIFVIPFSIALAEALAPLCFLLFLASLFRGGGGAVFAWIFVPALAYICLAAVVSACGIDPKLSLGKLPKLRWFLIVPVAAAVMSSPGRREALLKAFALGCGILSIKTLVWNPIRAVEAVRRGEAGATDFVTALIHEGSMTHSQMLMLGVVVVLGIALARAAPLRRSAWWLALLALETAALVLHYKRGAWVCAVVIVVVLIALRSNWKCLLLPVAVVLIVFAFPQPRARLSALSGEFSRDAGGRLTMWTRITPALIKEHPWGIGYRGLTNETMRKYAPQVERNRNHLHSNIAQVLVETGWFGLGVYLLWMGWAVADGIRYASRSKSVAGAEQVYSLVYLLMLVGLLLNGLIEYNFGDAEVMTVYAAIMGVNARAVRRDPDYATWSMPE